MKQKVAGLLVAVVLFSVYVSKAQVTTGRISGLVSDSTGAVLPGAKVIIENEDTGVSRSIEADAAGRYFAPSLNLGKYRVTASMEGFQTEVRSGIVLTVDRQAIVNFQLAVGAMTQSVEVTGEAPLVETTKSSVDVLVNDATIRELPLNGRDLAQLVLLNPGVAVTELPRNTGSMYGFGKLISISGFKFEDNLYLLDGTDINRFDNQIASGASGALFGTETVREFEVKTSMFSAAYGRALGGVMNAVTKSGTNSLHGTVFEFLRNSAMDARGFFDNKLPPFKRNQFGATAGGPIVRDKTFFFAGYEALRHRRSVTTITNVPDENMRKGILPGIGQVNVTAKIAPYLALFPLPTPGGRNYGDGRAQFIFADPQTASDNFGQLRIDHQFSEKDSFFARFTGSNSETVQQAGFPPDFKITNGMANRFLTLSETHIFSSSLLNTFRVAFNRTNPGEVYSFATWPAELLSVPNQPYPPSISVTGLDSLGGGDKPSGHLISNRFEYIDDLNLSRGNHSLQFGVNFQHMQFNEFKPDRPFGQWSFSSLQDFLGGRVNTYRGTPFIYGDYDRGFRQNFVGMYIQDDWRVRPDLTLNLGLRYDFYTIPKEVNGKVANLRHLQDPAVTVGDPYWKNKSWLDFSPRFGFAWSPFANGKTSVRGGAGIFFSRADFNLIWGGMTRDGYFSPGIQIRVTNPAFFPSAIAVIEGSQVQTGRIYPVTYDNLRTPRAYQWNLTVQRQLGEGMVASLAYVGNKGTNLSSNVNYNTPPAEWVNGGLRVRDGATVMNPKFDQIFYTGTNVDSWYNALQVNVQRRMSSGLQFQIAYTWSKSLNIADSNQTVGSTPGGGTVYYPWDFKVDKGRSGMDVPHIFSANYMYELPFGVGRRWLDNRSVANWIFGNWSLNGIVTLKSGQPFNLNCDIPAALSSLMTEKHPDAIAGRAPTVWGDPSVSRDPSGLSRYFNPTDVVYPGDPRALGNLGRRTMRGPGINTWDFGLFKNIRTGERVSIQFRAELFNVLNRANFSIPANSVYDVNGKVKGNAGVITRTVTSPREIQFGLKILF